jgi:DNA-binding CsgD family transcriptional regulator
MHRNSYISSLTEDQVLSYILRSISEGRIEDEIAERFDGDTKLVKKMGRCFEANKLF